MGSTFGHSFFATASTFNDPAYPDGTLTPQHSVKLTFSQANGTMELYIFEANLTNIYGWTRQHTQGGDTPANLDAYVTANPQTVGLVSVIYGQTTSIVYVPTKVTQVALMLSNRSASSVSFQGTAMTLVQQTLAQTWSSRVIWVVPGVVLLVLFSTLYNRRVRSAPIRQDGQPTV